MTSGSRALSIDAKMFEKIQDVHFGGDAHFVDGDRGLSEWRMTGTEASGERLDMLGDRSLMGNLSVGHQTNTTPDQISSLGT